MNIKSVEYEQFIKSRFLNPLYASVRSVGWSFLLSFDLSAMHLLNCNTLRLETFTDNKTLDYVILSHRWGEDEVSYQEMQQYGMSLTTSGLPPTPSSIENKAGFVKINNACRKALENRHKYIWIDTCCIDKTSSAELSEAINSMYSWYSDASICYTYMSDVLDNGVLTPSMGGEKTSSFRSSKWFTRGWTLQELIASPTLHFYSQKWQQIGTKETLAEMISDITGVDIEVLRGEDPRNMSVAKRMFWASRRETERQEDIAYCLMGLFDVNMPLLYGEGGKAFLRLQEKILENSDDHSIFAWNELTRSHGQCDLLAMSPAYFTESGHIVPIKGNPDTAPYNMTNQGLRIEVPLVEIGNTGCYIVPLNCIDSRHGLGPKLIALQRVSSNPGQTHQYVRICREIPNSLIQFNRRLERKTIYILRRPEQSALQLYQPRIPVYKFQVWLAPSFDFTINGVIGPSSQDAKSSTKNSRTLLLEKSIGIVGGIEFRGSGRECPWLLLIIGVNVNFNIALQFHRRLTEGNLEKVLEWCKSQSKLDIADKGRRDKRALNYEDHIDSELRGMFRINLRQDTVNGENIYVLHLEGVQRKKTSFLQRVGRIF